jgi:hypothetical protein
LSTTDELALRQPLIRALRENSPITNFGDHDQRRHSMFNVFIRASICGSFHVKSAFLNISA